MTILNITCAITSDELNATGPHQRKVNTGSGDGLVLSGIKPSPEPRLTSYGVTWRPKNLLRILSINLGYPKYYLVGTWYLRSRYVGQE